MHLIRNIVATIDNLPRSKAAPRLLPVQPTSGALSTTNAGDNLVIAPDNSARYAPVVALVHAIDTKQLVAIYVRFYPLFQQAYRELGYPDGYFNDRLVAVIDHLLATPDVKPPIALVQPKVLYQYADPELGSAVSGTESDDSRRARQRGGVEGEAARDSLPSSRADRPALASRPQS